LVSVKKKDIIKLIESFKYRKRKSKNHGQIAYDIYSSRIAIQLNYRPILIVGGRGSKKNDFGDIGLNHIADAMGIGQKFLKELLSGIKSKDDYEKYRLRQLGH